MKTTTLFIIILLILIPSFIFIQNSQPLADEAVHHDQIIRLTQTPKSLNQYVTTIPGYHFLLSIPVKFFDNSNIEFTRLFTFFISLFTILTFYLTTNKINPKKSKSKLLQFTLFPILFPLFFLIYTDILSILLITLSLLFILKDKPNLSALMAITSLTVRQTNIIWLAFLFTIPYIQKNNLSFSIPKISQHLKKHWLFLIGFAAFTIFALLNKGIAIGDKTMHPFSISLGNIYFALFLFFLLFLPHNLSNFNKIFNLIKKKKIIFPFLFILLLIYLFTFKISHTYNQAIYSYYLHNKILQFITSNLPLKILFFIPIAYSILSLFTTKLQKESYYILYPFSFLLLLPTWLIEQRYYLIPFTFFILFKKQKSKFIENITIIYFLIISLFLIYGIKNLKFFL